MWIVRKKVGKKENEINSEAGDFYISSGRINLLVVALSQGRVISLSMTTAQKLVEERSSWGCATTIHRLFPPGF